MSKLSKMYEGIATASDNLKKIIESDPWSYLSQRPKKELPKVPETLCPHYLCDGGGIIYGGTNEDPTEKRCLCNEPCDDMDDDSDLTNLK